MTFTAIDLLSGIVLALAISLAARRLGLLTASGAAAAIVVGAIAFDLGSGGGAATLLAFFISSNLLGRFRRSRKLALGFEKPGARDAWQVLANGGAACAALVAGRFLGENGQQAGYVCFAAALAEANADTWATEAGAAFSAKAWLITSFKAVEAGRSGAVSLPGTAAALAGALLIAVVAAVPGGLRGRQIALIFFCGFAGSVFDSVLGAAVQARYRSPAGAIVEKRSEGSVPCGGFAWFGNDLVNFSATSLAAAAAAVLWHWVR